MYRSLSQDYRLDLPPRLRVHPQHWYRRTQWEMILRQVQQPHEDGVHAFEHWEASCMTPQKTKQMRTPNGYKATCCTMCQNGWRTSQKIWWTTECQHHGTHPQALLSNEIRNLQESGIWETPYLCSLPERPKLRSGQENQDYKGSLQETQVMQKPRAEKFGDLITAVHKVFRRM